MPPIGGIPRAKRRLPARSRTQVDAPHPNIPARIQPQMHATRAPAAPPGPFTDRERRVVAKNRTTRAYRNAIKSAYVQQPGSARRAERQRISAEPASQRTPEQNTVMGVHRRYLQRKRAGELMDALHYRINSKPASTWSKHERRFMLQYAHDQAAAQQERGSQIYTDAQHELVNHAEARARGLASLAHVIAHPDKHNPDADLKVSDPKKLAALGFHKAGMIDKLAAAPMGALVSGLAVADAVYHDPVGVPVKTAKQVLHAIPAVPGGVYDLVRHPGKTISQEASQFAGRSGEKFNQRVATIRKEGGLNYAADAAAVTGIGSVASSGAKVLLERGLRDAAEGSTRRIALRTSGGTVRLPKQRGAAGEAITHFVRTHRAQTAEKRLRAAEAGGHPVDVLEYQSAKANRDAGHVVESVGKFAGHKQRRLVATQRGRSIHGFRSDKGRRLKADTKALNRLNAKEKKAFYYASTFGIRNADQANHVLTRLHDVITTTRKRDGVQVTGSLKKSDMLPDIKAMLAAPHQYFTENLGRTVEAMRADSAKAAAEDPTLHPFVERRRRYAPIAQALGLEKGRLLDDLGSAKLTGRKGNGDFQGDANLEETWGLLKGKPNSTDLKVRETEAGRRVSVERFDGDGKLVGRLVFDVGDDGTPHNLDVVVHSTKQRNGVAKSLYDRARVEGFDVRNGGTAARSAEGAAFHQAYTVPPLRDFHEDDAAFVDRVAKHTKELGLAEPLYFKSERYVGPSDFAPHALGGIRATRRGRSYTGENLAAGLQDTRPTMYLQGKAENIKRKHNWNLVANILQDNGVKELTQGSPGGSTVSALREHMAQAGVDMNSVALWNPGVYRQLAHDVNTPSPDMASEFAQSEEFDHANISAALQHSIVRLRPDGSAVDGTGLPVKADALRESKGWQPVPTTVLNELERQMQPSGKYARAWDIAKGKASRFMLASGNIPWLSFQVVQNMGAAAAATGGRALNPANWVQAAQWWHDLTPEQRDHIGGQLGMDVTGADSHQIRLGASTNSDMVNMYRAFKAHPFWHTGIANGRGPSISELNPFELMVRADRKQNNVARIIAGYSLAKRDTIRQMGESMGAVDKAQLKLTSIMTKPPAEQLRAMAENHAAMEDHADAVVKWMGDYTSLTATERKVISRTAMFYPYMRYSLRLLFYTMPVDHPAVTAVLAELGQMRADELQKLFGKGELPFNLGKIYFGSKGHVTSIDLKRANPALNSLVDVATQHNLPGLVGIAPPWFQWAYDQASQTSSFTGKAWKYNGHAAPYGNPQLPLTSGVRARILANDVLGLTFPYREAVKLTQSGPQGDDSLLFSPRPTFYKGQTAVSKLEAKFGNRRTRFANAHKSILHDLVPIIPAPDRAAAQAREDRIVSRAMAKPKKRLKTGYLSGSGSTGGLITGGSSGSTGGLITGGG